MQELTCPQTRWYLAEPKASDCGGRKHRFPTLRGPLRNGRREGPRPGPGRSESSPLRWSRDGGRFSVEDCDEGPDGVVDVSRRRSRRKAQDGDPRVVGRSVSKGVSEFEIEGDEASLLSSRSFDDSIVACGTETFVVNGRDVMPHIFQDQTGMAPRFSSNLSFNGSW